MSFRFHSRCEGSELLDYLADTNFLSLLLACQACLRTARFDGRDLSTVQCVYTENATTRGGGRTGKRKETPMHESVEKRALLEAGGEQPVAKGTMADLLNGTSVSDAVNASNFYGMFSAFLFRFSHRLTSYSSLGSLPAINSMSHPSSSSQVPWNAWPPLNPTNVTSTRDGTFYPSTTTPPLTYSSASSPTETAFSSPPTPSASPAPTPIVQPVPSTSSYVPYFQQLPTVYAHGGQFNPSAHLPYPYPYATTPTYPNNFNPSRTSTNEYNRANLQQQQYIPPPNLPMHSSYSFAPSQYMSEQLRQATYPQIQDKMSSSTFVFPPPLPTTLSSLQTTTLDTNASSFASLDLPPIALPSSTTIPSSSYPVLPQNNMSTYAFGKSYSRTNDDGAWLRGPGS